MSAQPSRSSARLLALLALMACGLAVVVVVATSLGSGGGSDGEQTSAQTADQAGDATETAPQRRPRANYTVKPGDTLGGIAEKTGVPIETLQLLNPELDPQALISGQKIKLRE
ncbi:MAG TPA: LysM domain-containing protein [Thermoleophilaceae bacterium]|nr:LysM domain-containing protein [Thermoleophilaceae bacterium]